MELGEALGAVAALEQKRLARRDPRQVGGEVARLASEDQRRVAAELRRRGVERGGVGIVGQLARLGAGSSCRGPSWRPWSSSYLITRVAMRAKGGGGNVAMLGRRRGGYGRVR